MTSLRVALRVAGLVGWTVGIVLVAVLPAHALVVLDRRGVLSLPQSTQWRDRTVSWWAGGCTCVLNLHVTVRGTPPTPPYFLVANHLSYVDVVLLQSLTPCVMVAKSDVRAWPVIGALAALGGTVFIDRRAHRDIMRVNAVLDAALDRGQGVVVFPEGTSSRGETVLPFRASLLAPLEGTDRPVHTASLSYRTPEGTPPAQTHVCWWGDMTFGDHILDLLALPRVDATVTFDVHRPGAEDDRKALAADLEAQVRASFVPCDANPDARENVPTPVEETGG